MQDGLVVSLPALAASLRQSDDHPFTSSISGVLLAEELVQSYRVDRRLDQEIESAVQVIGHALDRMQRLDGAYGEWQRFDPTAYFDLRSSQADLLVQISERISTVHVVFHADLLLPAFQEAERFWSQRFVPAYQAAAPFLRGEQRANPFAHAFLADVQPGMVDRWHRVVAVIHATRAILVDDVSFLAATGGEAERYRWRQAWQADPPSHLDPALLPEIDQLSTLTLSSTFPLPMNRQPGRMRRLRRRWERRKK